MTPFTHLHVHSQYSILDGASSLPGIIQKVKDDGMDSVALTDHGTMYGIKAFHDEARKNDIKPILGVEAYLAARDRHKKQTKQDRSGYHLILLAKNLTGYHNLVRLVSYANIEGYYYKPRIDRELLEQYSEGLIVSSACIGGEIPKLLLNNQYKQAEEALLWYKNIFGADFYLELMRHNSEDTEMREIVYNSEMQANSGMLELADKHNVKVIASNDVHFINADDADAHDLLICLNTGKEIDDPNRMRYTKEEYLKTQEEMNELFSDIPEALQNTREIVDKVEVYELNSEPIMPEFPIPETFSGADEYLRHLSFEGAKERYGEITDTIRDRLDFELDVIKNMGFPGYFLIVWDFIRAAKEDLGVIVGPGRGSAAGSAVAYCLNITNIDPIQYELLFERFLNPDRVSMPDIDIDFDDDGRDKVLDWVTRKYGKEKVAHIATFGSMAAKLAIRDVGRILKLPLQEADRLAKMVPDTPKITLDTAFQEVPELDKERYSDNPLVAKTLKFAHTLEGSVRQTGIHACGILIGRNDLVEHLPVQNTKESNLLTTQYDGNYVEDIGMLKMDFLGLKTLSIIKDTLSILKESKGIDIDIEQIPMDDAKTFELFCNAETTAIFQFESDGMKKHLMALQPNRFVDLVAMNALYRPGPMEYIPSYINRKHGREEITYDHPIMKEYLENTYGITVFQEQVMLLARALAGLSRGQSDTLRKAMGKKKFKLMEELKVKFHEGCMNNEKFLEGCKQVNKDPEELVQKIWKDWEAFASYAFNKSHSVCYAYVAYQTGYLKAHYPAEFMASVLSRNITDIKKITTFMDECRRMGLSVLGPDVNESHLNFTVNKDGAIRFGMAAIKGVGENAVQEIVRERNENGAFKDIYDFVERINLQTVNRKTLESLALSGGFDNLGELRREHYVAQDNKAVSFLETLVRYGQNYQNEKNNSQQSLFEAMGNADIPKPAPPETEEWNNLQKLNQEKELVGIYLSAHPLDNFKIEIDTFCNAYVKSLNAMKENAGKELKFPGIVVASERRISKNGKEYGSITVEDYTASHKIMLFGKAFKDFSQFMSQGVTLFIQGKVEKRKDREDEYEFRVNNIEYLSEKREQIKKLAIKIPVDKLTQELIDELKNQIERNKGKSELNFLIYDPENTKIWVNMFSRNHHIQVTPEFMKYLDNHPNLEYKMS